MEELLKIYPFNLALKILGDEEEAIKISVPGILEALTTLKPRESGILEKRFKDKMTFQAIGENYGIGGTRVGQIQTNALRKMRHPSRKCLFMNILKRELYDIRERNENLKREYSELKSENETLKNTIKSRVENCPVEYLELNTRTKNCLMRNCIYTLRDITDMTRLELSHISKLGRGSIEDIIWCLKKYGMSLKD